MLLSTQVGVVPNSRGLGVTIGWRHDERRMKGELRENSALCAYSLVNIGPQPGRELHMESEMIEIVRSGAILLMGLTVIGAGVVVVFYG